MVCIFPYVGSIEAQVTVVPPQSTTVTLGDIATFSCTASPISNVAQMYYLTNIDPSNWASHGISQLAQTYSGNNVTVNLIVQGIVQNNVTTVTCRVIVAATTIYVVDTSPAAQLTVEGLCL